MADVVFETRGRVAVLRLNRPRVLNALNHDMIRTIRDRLDVWADDDAVSAVVIMGEGPRAFCAGGDIRAFRDSALAGGDEVCAFWRDEYELISRIGSYPKPYISLVHGIVMGGGLGLSVPAAFRVAAEDVICAMPECGIGFFPDVGASWFLSRAPGETGMYMALTGARLSRADAIWAGLMSHAAPQAKWPEFLDALAAGTPPDVVFAPATLSGPAPIRDRQALIDRVFSATSVAEILNRLDAEDDDFARDAAKTMRLRSPTSLKLAFRAVRAGAKRTLSECLQTDFRIACRVQAMADFCEGIRTTVVDKGAQPSWRPPQLSEVSEDALDACFQPLAEGDIEVYDM